MASIMTNLYFIESDNHIVLNKILEDIVKKNKFNLDEVIKFDLSERNISEVITELDTYSLFGDRKIALCRELSKVHEEVIRDNISNIIDICSTLKGEFVIIVEGNKEVVDYSIITIDEHVKMYLEDGISEMDAIKRVAKERGVAKSIIYKEYHIGK